MPPQWSEARAAEGFAVFNACLVTGAALLHAGAARMAILGERALHVETHSARWIEEYAQPVNCMGPLMDTAA